MSRSMPDPIPVKPQNDIYTALLGITLLASITGLVIIILRANALFPNSPLWGG